MRAPAIDKLYVEDTCAWARREARLLREGRLDEIDIENLAEEVEEMANSREREMKNRLIVLVMHLLKWRYQPERRPNPSWRRTIIEQRTQIEGLVEDNPSLEHIVDATLANAYPRARKNASLDTMLAISRFPAECPFTLDQVLGDDYFPD